MVNLKDEPIENMEQRMEHASMMTKQVIEVQRDLLKPVKTRSIEEMLQAIWLMFKYDFIDVAEHELLMDALYRLRKEIE